MGKITVAFLPGCQPQTCHDGDQPMRTLPVELSAEKIFLGGLAQLVDHPHIMRSAAPEGRIPARNDPENYTVNLTRRDVGGQFGVGELEHPSVGELDSVAEGAALGRTLVAVGFRGRDSARWTSLMSISPRWQTGLTVLMIWLVVMSQRRLFLIDNALHRRTQAGPDALSVLRALQSHDLTVEGVERRTQRVRVPVTVATPM
jgi:hypothetical protein